MGRIKTRLERGLLALRQVFGGESRIQSADALAAVLQADAARTAQATLFGYLKARMGTRYVAIFEDAAFQPSLRAAQEAMFSACLSDVWVFAAVELAQGSAMEAQLKAHFCGHVQRSAISGGLEHDAASKLAEHVHDRLGALDWACDPAQQFLESPSGLVNAAPVSDDFKRRDREMIVNSVRFQWIDVRRRLRRRMDRDAILATLRTSATR